MKYLGSAVTDMGIMKKMNQDSVCVKIADTEAYGQIAMGVLCDGMGGLEKGELASATVIRIFEEWFDYQLPGKIMGYTWEGMAAEWERMIKAANHKMLDYGKKNRVTLGTTVSAILIIEGKYMIAHVGDSRAYKINDSVEQLTEDQTFVAREVKRGNMLEEQARRDSRRNVLTQCVGASGTVKPDILHGCVEADSVYMLCSDGFWHELTTEEMYERFRTERIRNAEEMTQNSRCLIERVKQRNERDNISVALIKCEK